MQRVLVIDKNKKPLMPCHPARARELLEKGKAAVFRRYPFAIILNYEVEPDNQPIAFKVDPGSRTTGLALVADFKRSKQCIWAGELSHRGQTIVDNLLSRRQSRRRRNRKTRYRQPRFLNRKKSKGWLPPSLMSRANNISTWLTRLHKWSPISSLSMELVKFDTQRMRNPEVSGIEYQQGTLQGYEVREYLLEKWGRKCAYCGAKDIPLEVDHIIPKSRGGTNRTDNLTLACRSCNSDKDNKTASEYGFPNIQAQAKKSFKDAAAVNATRWKLFETLKGTGLPLETGTGGQTKYNRNQQNYAKAHWLDAACVGDSGENILVDPNMQPLFIQAKGRQSRQMCRVDRFGFPRTKAKQNRVTKGFQTGDVVKAVVTKGKKVETYVGRVVIRKTGIFNINDPKQKARDISYRYCSHLHKSDGYNYV